LTPIIWSPPRRTSGFTLIEVIGALVIFSVGVLMVLQLSGVLGVQMQYSAARSEIAVLGGQLLDSLEATPFDSLSAGASASMIMVTDEYYKHSTIISQITPVLYQIVVSYTPMDGDGPSYSATSYTSAVW
jgi:prepilin-type N-terminal cleavage/methylation domain-containing protein